MICSDSFRQLINGAAIVAGSIGVRWSTILNKPASVDALQTCEQSTGLRLSPSHEKLLRMSNGITMGLLLDQDNDPMYYGVHILSTVEIAQETAFNRRDFDTPESFMVIARYGMCGDQCLALSNVRDEKDEYPIVDAFNETPSNWGQHIIATSFETWVLGMLESVTTRKQHLAYWIDDEVIKSHGLIVP